MVNPVKPQPYGFLPAFERALAVALCTQPAVYSRIGGTVESVRLLDPVAQLAVQVAQEIARDGGHGPSAQATVVQRLRRRMTEGKITQAQLESVLGLLVDTDTPVADEIILEASPVLRRVAEGEAVRDVIHAYGSHKDLTPHLAKLTKAERIGIGNTGLGYKFGSESLARVKALRGRRKLSTGITDLDVAMSGGLPLRCLGMLIAQDKSGKSMWLLSVAVAAMVLGFTVAYATLELSREDVECRLIGNLTSLPYELVALGEVDDLVESRLPERGPLGGFRCEWFPAITTTMRDIIDWVGRVEEVDGEVHVLIVDYVDKVGSSNKHVTGSYEVQGNSTEELRVYVHEKGKYGWTASQAQRRHVADPRKHYGLDDVADSKGKTRVPDVVLSMIAPGDESLREWKIIGGRHGKQGVIVGPFPHNLNCAQIVAPLMNRGFTK